MYGNHYLKSIRTEEEDKQQQHEKKKLTLHLPSVHAFSFQSTLHSSLTIFNVYFFPQDQRWRFYSVFFFAQKELSA